MVNEIPADHPYRSDATLRARYEKKPNFALRRTLLVAGLGFAGVMGFVGVRAGINAHNQDALNAELSQPLPNVAADIRAGKINPADVTRVRISNTEYAWTAASGLTSDGHAQDTPIVSSIIEAQQGNLPQKGDQIIVPNSEIDPQK